MMASGIGLHIPGSKRPDDEEEGEEGEEPSLLGPGLLGKLDPTSRKKLDKPADIQFQDPKVIKAAISLQRVCRPVKQGPSFYAQWWQPLPARGRVLFSPPAPPPGPPAVPPPSLPRRHRRRRRRRRTPPLRRKARWRLNPSVPKKSHLSTQAYRLSSYVYRHFGPELFVNSEGNSSGARPQPPPAPSRLFPGAACWALPGHAAPAQRARDADLKAGLAHRRTRDIRGRTRARPLDQRCEHHLGAAAHAPLTLAPLRIQTLARTLIQTRTHKPKPRP